MLNSLPFRYIVTLDSEFHFGGHATPVEAGRSGERPQPVCLVAKELRSGRVWRLCCGEFGTQQPFPPQPPFPIGADAVVCLHASSLGTRAHHNVSWC